MLAEVGFRLPVVPFKPLRFQNGVLKQRLQLIKQRHARVLVVQPGQLAHDLAAALVL
jgi:hypothetical protein